MGSMRLWLAAGLAVDHHAIDHHAIDHDGAERS